MMIWFSLVEPDEYVDAKVEAHGSEYQGMFSCSDVELIEMVYIKLVYPSQLQLSL